jgi:hypothetical protein
MRTPRTDGDEQLGLGLRVPSRPLRLSRDLSRVPLDRYRIPEKDGRKWKAIARERMALAEWLAIHGDADGSRIFPSVASMMRHFGWSHGKTFYLLNDLKELQLLKSSGLTGEHGTRVRRMDLAAFIGAGVQDSAGAGVQDSRSSPGAGVQHSRAGVQRYVGHNRHLTDTKIKPKAGSAVENGSAQNPAAQTAASSPSPLPIAGNQRPLPQRIEFAHVRRLSKGAVFVYENAEACGKPLDYSSWKEDLKRWAAENGIPYDAESIAKALDVAEREMAHRRLAAVAGSRR